MLIILERILRLILESESHCFRLSYPEHTSLDLSRSSLPYFCRSYYISWASQVAFVIENLLTRCSPHGLLTAKTLHPLLLRHRSPSVSQLQGAQGRSGTKAGRKRKQSSFPVSTPRPAQTLSTLAPETSPWTSFQLGVGGGRHSRSCQGGGKQGRLGWWEREVGWWLVPPPLDQRSEL